MRYETEGCFLIWIIIFFSAALAAFAGIFYLFSRVRRLAPFCRLTERHKVLSWVAAAAPVTALSAGIFCCFNLFTMIVVILHLMFIWIACDIIGTVCHKITKKKRHYGIEAAAVLFITSAVLGIGWYYAHDVRATRYSLQTDKSLGGAPLRIVLFADSHLGVTMNGDGFAKEMDRIQAETPDLIIIAGDFVDDDTEKQDMLAACEKLGSMKTEYGIFYCYGNHDNGYFGYRNFTPQELRDALEANHVSILEDSAQLIDDRFYLIGRKDRNMEDRISALDLTAGLDASKYIIMVDHQPNDYQNEADAGADLVLSGHTHGGHIFPAGQIGLLLRMNDAVYGKETRGTCDFIVTSGISGWAIPFKTGCISEYCVIDISES